ncbi:MAG: SH3-like domain-containing protein [Dehalococcoidia bacterium]
MGSEGMTPRFQPGDRVRVSDRQHQGHHRVPSYVKGKSGTVARLWGAYRNPEELAYGGDGLPRMPLYHVVFNQQDLWPDYSGAPADRLAIDIYDHWLQSAEEEK